MLPKDSLPDCPIATVISMIGSKCKLSVLYRLLSRPWRFNELKRDIHAVSPKVLSESLRSLEADGLVTRTVFNEMPPHVEYALSDLGQSMRPMLREMHAWGTYYLERMENPADSE